MPFQALVIAVALAIALPAAAQPDGAKAGVATTVHGQVTVARLVLPQPVALKLRDDLFLRDLVATRESSLARILLGGKAIVTIRELSSLSLTEEDGRAAVDLRAGTVFLGVARALLRRGESVEVRTPSAVAAVRGSALVVEVVEVGGVLQQIFTALEASVPIAVLSRANPALAVALNARQRVTVIGLGAAATLGPVTDISPAQARAAALAAEIPRSAEHGDKAPAATTERIAGVGVNQAAALASVVVPAAGGIFDFRPGTTVTVPTTEPLVSLVDTTLLTPYSLVTLSPAVPCFTGGGGFLACEDLNRRGLGGNQPADATFAGPILDVHGSRIENQSTLVVIGNGSTVTSTTTAPSLWVDASQVEARGILEIRGQFIANPPSRLSLVGPLFAATNGSTVSTGTVVSVLGGVEIVDTSPEPFLLVEHSTVSTGVLFSETDSFRTVAIVPPFAPTNIRLAGPLLVAEDSAITARTHVVDISGGTLIGTSPESLVQLSGARVTAGSGFGLGSEALVKGRVVNIGESTSRKIPFGPENIVDTAVSLAGPLLRATASTLELTGDVVGVNGGSLASTARAPLIQLTDTTVVAGDRDVAVVLNLGQTGGPGDVRPTSVVLAGPVLSSTGGRLRMSAGLLNIGPGSQLTVTGSTDPLLSIVGGEHELTRADFAAIQVRGPFAGLRAEEMVDGVTLSLATTEPLRHRGSLLETSGATVTSRRPFVMDSALLDATAPIFSFKAGSVFNATSDVVSVLLASRATSQGPLVKLDASTLNVLSGSLFAVSNASLLRVVGDLLSLANGSTLNLSGASNGFLLSADFSAVVNISGALVAFGGTGNRIVVGNRVTPTTTIAVGGASIPVALMNGASPNQISIAGTAIKNPAGGSIAFPNNGSLIRLDGPGARVTIAGN